MNQITGSIDAQRLTLILDALRLPAIKQTCPEIAERSDKEGWPAARFLAALAEHEIAEPDRRRIERHLGEAQLPRGKTLDSLSPSPAPWRSVIAKLDKYHLLILDDLAYVTKGEAETSVLFELIIAPYESRSTLITVNQPFGEWGKIFPDPAMTLVAADRLVHHATIFEINVESYRRRAAV